MSDIRKFSGFTATIDGSKHATLKEAEAHTIRVKTEAALKGFAELQPGSEPSGLVFSAECGTDVIPAITVGDIPAFLLHYKADILAAFNQVARTRKPRTLKAKPAADTTATAA